MNKLHLMGKNHLDDYDTPKYAFDILKKYIPKNSIIFECAVGKGKLKKLMEDEGYKVVYSKDFSFNVVQSDTLFGAYLNTRITERACFIGHHGCNSPDYADILDLRLRTGIGTIRQRHSEFMVELKAALDPRL